MLLFHVAAASSAMHCTCDHHNHAVQYIRAQLLIVDGDVQLKQLRPGAKHVELS